MPTIRVQLPILFIGRLIVIAVFILLTGCATKQSEPQYPSQLVTRDYHYIRIAKDVKVPDTLFVPSPDIGQSAMIGMMTGMSAVAPDPGLVYAYGSSAQAVGATGGALASGISSSLASRVQLARAKDVTAAVRKDIDFQQVIAKIVRDSFSQTVKKWEGWEVLPDDSNLTADATFSLAVLKVGFEGPTLQSFKIRYTPTITVLAILEKASTTSTPATSPNKTDSSIHLLPNVCYARVETNSSSKMISDAALNLGRPTGFSALPGYTGNPEMFRQAYQEAMEDVMNHFETSWSSD